MSETHVSALRARMDRFVRVIGKELGTDEQRLRFGQYALGLLLPGDRKSMEPMAARIDPSHAMARYKSFQKFTGVSEWNDVAVRRASWMWARPAVLESGPVKAWIIDDTGFLKQGKNSVFVQRQYTGSAGKVTNCQIGVSLSIATDTMSMPIDMELYMPRSWADDPDRREAAKVPESLKFRTKPEIALTLVAGAADDGIPLAPVLADCAYGDDDELRLGLEVFGLDYAVGLRARRLVMERLADGSEAAACRVVQLGEAIGRSKFTKIRWRQGRRLMTSRFALRRVRMPGDGGGLVRGDPDLWLLIEWPPREKQPTAFWVSNLPATTTLKELVTLVQMRWRIERDYEDMKGELGLDHFEGRSYVGWNHHVSVCIATFAFLLTERAGPFSPEGVDFKALAPATPAPRPRGCAAAA